MILLEAGLLAVALVAVVALGIVALAAVKVVGSLQFVLGEEDDGDDDGAWVPSPDDSAGDRCRPPVGGFPGGRVGR